MSSFPANRGLSEDSDLSRPIATTPFMILANADKQQTTGDNSSIVSVAKELRHVIEHIYVAVDFHESTL